MKAELMMDLSEKIISDIFSNECVASYFEGQKSFYADNSKSNLELLISQLERGNGWEIQDKLDNMLNYVSYISNLLVEAKTEQATNFNKCRVIIPEDICKDISDYVAKNEILKNADFVLAIENKLEEQLGDSTPKEINE